MEIKNLNINKLQINNGQVEGLPKNPRFIRDERFAQLVKSISDAPEMLALRELLVYPFSGKYIVIGGNMRLRACKELGYKELPCKVLDSNTPVEKLREYTIKDNQAFGQDDWDILANEWDEIELQDWGVEIPADLEQEEEEQEEGTEDDNFDFDQNTPKEASSKLGDIYQLGEHRLICGDSTDAKYVEALMASEKADLLVTDPPYNVNYEGGTGMKIQNDNMEDSAFLNFLCDAFSSANNVMREGGAFYIWHADYEHYNFETAVKKTGWEVRQCLIWNKNSLVLGRKDYQLKHEPCLYGWKGGASHYFVDKRNLVTVIEDSLQNLEDLTKDEMKQLLQEIRTELPMSVIDCNKPHRNGDHPTMKPIPLISQQIMNSSRKGDIVLDIFGGSGTTLIACEKLGRKCRMVEYDPIYVDVIIKRWEELTGQQAKLLTNIKTKE